MNEAAVIITAIATLVTALTALISVLVNSRQIKKVDTKVDEVHTEIKTANGLTVAQLADAQETRRIDKIPVAKQTGGEKEHIEEVPPEVQQ